MCLKIRIHDLHYWTSVTLSMYLTKAFTCSYRGLMDTHVAWIKNCLGAKSLLLNIQRGFCFQLSPATVTISPALFFVMIIDLPSELHLVCSMFVTDTKMGSKTIEVEIIQSDLLKTVECAARNAAALNALKSQHLDFSSHSSQLCYS